MAHVSEPEPHKRMKRESVGSVGPLAHQLVLNQRTPPPLPGPIGTINYLLKPNAERLPLIIGNGDTFSDILGLMTEYEGVLERQESLAASLGAKLTGPRLLKGIDRFFDGPIKTTPLQPIGGPVTWVDIVTFAQTNPAEFILSNTPEGSRRCRMSIKGYQVEIMEDDWRLISSGALDRFSQERPFEEDEMAEMATLDILEQRTSVLYKRADEVAARARILHHRLGHRKHDIARRRNAAEGGSPTAFRSTTPGYRASGSNQSYDLHADLLQQFISQQASHSPPSYASGGPVSPALSTSQSSLPAGRASGGARTSASSSTDAGVQQQQVYDPGEALRALITRKTDRLPKGAIIIPPCDRCRRLRSQCIKHLTACQGCTKKHARCSWKAVTDEEVAIVRQELGLMPYGDMDMETGHTPRGGGAVMGDVSPGTRNFEYTPRLDSEGREVGGMGSAYTTNSMLMNRPPGHVMSNVPRDPPRVSQLVSMATIPGDSGDGMLGSPQMGAR